MVDLSTNFLGLRFKNPIVAASGLTTTTPDNMKRCIEAGVGAVTAKTILFDPEGRDSLGRQDNYVLQTYKFLHKYGYRHQMTGYCGHGFLSIERGLRYLEEIKPVAEKEGVVLIGSILQEPPVAMSTVLQEPPVEETPLVELARRVEAAGADIIELPTGCPFIPVDPTERSVDRNRRFSYILKSLKGKIGVPFYLKPGLHGGAHLLGLMKIIEDSGAYNACNVMPDTVGTFIDVEIGRPVAPRPKFYGRGDTAPGAYLTALAATATEAEIISTGGIWNWRDVVERLMCGAALVGIETAIMYHGYRLFTELLDGLGGFMDRRGYKTIGELKGIAAPYVENPTMVTEWLERRLVPKESVRITVDESKCNGCKLCLVCLQDALTMKDGIATIDSKLCIRCGICESICPTEAIQILI